MSLRIDFVETSRAWRGLAARSIARQAIAAAAVECGITLRCGAEICVHLVGDADIQSLNAQWRGVNAPTNVLSFPAAEPARLRQARLLGDVLIAFETASREAEQEHKTFADHYRHLVVHGFLHLLGFDHIADAQAEAMEALETTVLARLGVADPYAASQLAGVA
jgi:probable rRNA maturation factor